MPSSFISINLTNKNDWLLIIAIGLTLVAVGAILDFFLKNKEVKALHAKFKKLADILTNTPIKDWQRSIAEKGICFFERLENKTIETVTDNFVMRPLSKVSSFIQDKWTDEFTLNEASFVGSYVSLIFIFLIIPLLYYCFNLWPIGAISLPFIILCFTAFLLFIDVVFFSFSVPEKIYKLLVGTPTMSAILSLIATLIMIYFIPVSYLNSKWFQLIGSEIKPRYPLLLPILNFPFDFATIAVSLYLLRFVVYRGKFIFFVAVIDIIFSAIFTLLLYSTIKCAENNWAISHFPQFISEAYFWFKDIAIYGFDRFIIHKPSSVNISNMPDLHLLPILLTTFIPVFIYMSIFIFLSFSKVIMVFSGRFFEVIGERDESVFKQLGFLIATTMAALKAIYNYMMVLP